MNTEKILRTRSNARCELCSATENLGTYQLPPNANDSADECVLICTTCLNQIENRETPDTHHWRCLSDCMWSSTPAVQVVAWRMLNRLHDESWAQDLLNMLYIDDATLTWAQSASPDSSPEGEPKHLDSNGALLQAGDTVTLIKDLPVKGAKFTAKRGTAVRGISLVANNHEHIEGRVEGQQIVILTKFIKKSN